MAKYCLKVLKHNQQSPLWQGFVAIGTKADSIYSRTESGVEKKRLLNTDDMVGGERYNRQRRLAQ
jgi:hypothetical protein